MLLKGNGTVFRNTYVIFSLEVAPGLVALHGLLKNVDASAFPSSMKMMLNTIFSHASVRVLDRMSEK